jgi:hypothetical protein
LTPHYPGIAAGVCNPAQSEMSTGSCAGCRTGR